jgi:large subunit ribosomal protein L21
MYAIVEIAGQQFKVELGKKIFVHRLEVEKEKEIEFDQVLLIEDEGVVTVGEPTIKGAKIEGKILDHMRGDKVIVFKKKRKKGYRIKNGHRQNFTQVEIISINGKSLPKKAAPKKKEAEVVDVNVAEEPVKEKKSTVKKPAAIKEESPVKKSAEKKSAEKKSAEKKSAEKKPPVKKTAEKKQTVRKSSKNKE